MRSQQLVLEAKRDPTDISTVTFDEVSEDRAFVIKGEREFLNRAIALAVADMSEGLIWEIGYKVRQSPSWMMLSQTDRRVLISAFPRAELSRIWTTVRDEVRSGRLGRLEGYERWIDHLDIWHLLERSPTCLSGGETTRVILASHMATLPEVLVLDRTLDELDVGTRRRVLSALLSENCIKRLVVRGEGFLRNRVTVVDTNTGIAGTDVSLVTDEQPDEVERMSGELQISVARVGGGGPPVIEVEKGEIERNGKMVAAGINFEGRAGEIVWLLGRNGSGKSSMLEVVAGVVDPADRVVCHGNVRLHGEAHRIGYAPQDPDADVTEQTLLEEVTAAFDGSLGKGGEAAAIGFLREAGFSEKVWSTPLREEAALRRVASVCSAVARAGSLCLLDEPTLWLSVPQRKSVGRAILGRVREGLCVICATHDITFIREMNPQAHAQDGERKSSAARES